MDLCGSLPSTKPFWTAPEKILEIQCHLRHGVDPQRADPECGVQRFAHEPLCREFSGDHDRDGVELHDQLETELAGYREDLGSGSIPAGIAGLESSSLPLGIGQSLIYLVPAGCVARTLSFIQTHTFPATPQLESRRNIS